VSRENATAKAARYLTEGRVTITAAGEGYARALVRGDGAVYQVADGRTGRRCSCSARTLCSHLRAVGLVTAPRTS
jgi:hypothetical protein